MPNNDLNSKVLFPFSTPTEYTRSNGNPVVNNESRSNFNDFACVPEKNLAKEKKQQVPQSALHFY